MHRLVEGAQATQPVQRNPPVHGLWRPRCCGELFECEPWLFACVRMS